MRSHFLRGYGTTRRFQRTTHEAFLCDARTAIALERPPSFRWLLDAVCWVLGCAILLAVLAAAMWWPA